jgi:hypothetical protein
MRETWWIAAALAAHLVASLAVFAAGIRRGLRPGAAVVLWMLLLPGFGPVLVHLLLMPGSDSAPEADRLRHSREGRPSAAPAPAATGLAVPVEEALIINEPRQRRALMMNMLRDDPKKYLDVLLVARFNEDPEIVHYATATLMELQRQIQMELQRQQAVLEEDPGNDQVRLAYVKLLDEYCRSGLMEGQLLRRRLLLLEAELDECLARMDDPELYCMAVRNHLSLGQGARAKETAVWMLEKWPEDERSWLEMMRVCAETHDDKGMDSLLRAAVHAPVDWSPAGREKLQYWMGRVA